MVYRTAYKSKTRSELILRRFALSARQTLRLNYDLCIGCKVCEKICPEKAVSEASPPLVADGRLVRKNRMDIDAGKCTFCGECVVLCPLNAILIEVNGVEKIPVIESNAFPSLLRDINVNVGLCDITCKLACEETCPTKAIKIILSESETPGKLKISEVRIDRRLCIYCKKCQEACPMKAIIVLKPISGLIEIDTSLCPERCQACVDICPSKCIIIREDEKPSVIKEFCIFCGACVEICPAKAIAMKRTRVLHSEIKSGAWNEALEKLTSRDVLIKEISTKRGRKIAALASPFKIKSI
ncbi:MAG: 4Fe-4S binding protein [Candidatus Bathyarchaeia archaeon]|nr:4Fe-4S binding protein [Candidatus Bathyarchaeota archaeon]